MTSIMRKASADDGATFALHATCPSGRTRTSEQAYAFSASALMISVVERGTFLASAAAIKVAQSGAFDPIRNNTNPRPKRSSVDLSGPNQTCGERDPGAPFVYK